MLRTKIKINAFALSLMAPVGCIPSALAQEAGQQIEQSKPAPAISPSQSEAETSEPLSPTESAPLLATPPSLPAGVIAPVFRGGGDVLPSPVGRGFYIDSEGLFITILSTPLGGSETVLINEGSSQVQAKILAYEESTGLALFRVAGAATTPLALGRSKGTTSGSLCFLGSNGNPNPELPVARIIGKEISSAGQPFPVPLLHLNCPATSHLPGTPVLDDAGTVIGVVHCAADHTDPLAGCFALPVEVLEKVQDSYAQFGRVETAWLGLVVDSRRSSAAVIELREDSPAAAAGIMRNDVIRELGGHAIGDLRDMVNACYYLVPGKPVELKVLRGVEDLTFQVTPVSLPAPPSGGIPIADLPKNGQGVGSE